MTHPPITRDVILDLLPLYLAGEASEDTRRLVAAYLETDPKLAVLAGQAAVSKDIFSVNDRENQLDTLLDEVGHELTPFQFQETHNMNHFQRTKRLVFQQGLFLALAIFTSLLLVAFRFNDEGVHWLWSDLPKIGWLLLVVSAFLWIAYLNTVYRLRSK